MSHLLRDLILIFGAQVSIGVMIAIPLSRAFNRRTRLHDLDGPELAAVAMIAFGEIDLDEMAGLHEALEASMESREMV